MLRHVASGKAITVMNEVTDTQETRMKMCVQSDLTAGSFFTLLPTFKVGTRRNWIV